MCQVLQSATGCYYKVGQVLQSVTIITKWEVTVADGTSTWYCLVYFPLDHKIENYHCHESWFVYCNICNLIFHH